MPMPSITPPRSSTLQGFAAISIPSATWKSTLDQAALVWASVHAEADWSLTGLLRVTRVLRPRCAPQSPPKTRKSLPCWKAANSAKSLAGAAAEAEEVAVQLAEAAQQRRAVQPVLLSQELHFIRHQQTSASALICPDSSTFRIHSR